MNLYEQELGDSQKTGHWSMLLLVKRIKKSLAEMYVCNWLTVLKPSFQSLSVWIFYFLFFQTAIHGEVSCWSCSFVWTSYFPFTQHQTPVHRPAISENYNVHFSLESGGEPSTTWSSNQVMRTNAGFKWDMLSKCAPSLAGWSVRSA